MRIMVLGALVMASACSDQAPGGPSADIAAQAANAALSTSQARHDDRADSPSAREARLVVERYFAAIAAKDFRSAHALWGNNGKDSGGSADDLARTIAIYSRYEPEVGNPTAIRARDGMQYILVSAKLFVENRKTGNTASRDGNVMLRRSANPDDADIAKRDWRIWGIDLRVRS
ncbi:MAG: hypothetical protein H2054_07740 [Sphingomonas sp.]|uniref:hypothetical protein n=1 Tax=Sphingomonas sp. TaxID=28214 RepID=UPI0017B17DF5|nr:hypothetical protein [Sphingomonas sp.]